MVAAGRGLSWRATRTCPGCGPSTRDRRCPRKGTWPRSGELLARGGYDLVVNACPSFVPGRPLPERGAVLDFLTHAPRLVRNERAPAEPNHFLFQSHRFLAELFQDARAGPAAGGGEGRPHLPGGRGGGRGRRVPGLGAGLRERAVGAAQPGRRLALHPAAGGLARGPAGADGRPAGPWCWSGRATPTPGWASASRRPCRPPCAPGPCRFPPRCPPPPTRPSWTGWTSSCRGTRGPCTGARPARSRAPAGACSGTGHDRLPCSAPPRPGMSGYDSTAPGFLPAWQDAPSAAFLSHAPCRNITCLNKLHKTCRNPRCFEGCSPLGHRGRRPGPPRSDRGGRHRPSHALRGLRPQSRTSGRLRTTVEEEGGNFPCACYPWEACYP